MKIENIMPDEAILSELGHRVASVRLGRHLTQAQLADAAGVSKRTIERLERGDSIQLVNLIRSLRALRIVSALEHFLPDAPTNPILLTKRHGKPRQRVRSSRAAPKTGRWTWGDEQ